MARTPQEKSTENDSENNFTSAENIFVNISEISETWVADHAVHVTRMLPGGMFVQGIFCKT